MAHFRVQRVVAALGLTTFALLGASAQAGAAASEPSSPPLLPVPVTIPQLPVSLPELPPLVNGGRPEPAGETTATTARPRTPRPRPSPAVPPPPSAGAQVAPSPGLAGPQARQSARAHVPEDSSTAAVVTMQAVESARQFSLPLGMAGAIAAFLVIQACLDRRDPKLAKAPLTDEVLGFS